MKKNLFLYLFFSLAISFCFSTEYYVGNDLSDFCLIQVNENDALVVYEQDNSIKGLLKTETQLREILIPFTEEISNIQGLKTYDYSFPVVCFLGNYGEKFGLFFIEFSNNSFSDVFFVPIETKFFGNIEKIQIQNQDNWINYSFIKEGELYCVQWNVKKYKLEHLFKFNFAENINHYEILSEEDSMYGYAITFEDELYLFSCIDGYIFSEKRENLTSKDISLFMSFSGNKYCIYVSGTEKKVIKYEDKDFCKIISLLETEELPLLLYDNLDVTKKICKFGNKILINDMFQTQFEYDFLEIIPTDKKVFFLINNNKGWKLIETNFSETEEFVIDINKTCEFIQFYLDNEFNLVFSDKENRNIIFFNLFNKVKKEFYTSEDLELNILKRDAINLFLLTLKIDNFDLVFLDNEKQIRTEDYLLIRYTQKRNEKYYYALYNEAGYIKVEEFTK